MSFTGLEGFPGKQKKQIIKKSKMGLRKGLE
jgi:hypothetical protein